jgi:hypothetical protein
MKTVYSLLILFLFNSFVFSLPYSYIKVDTTTCKAYLYHYGDIRIYKSTMSADNFYWGTISFPDRQVFEITTTQSNLNLSAFYNLNITAGMNLQINASLGKIYMKTATNFEGHSIEDVGQAQIGIIQPRLGELVNINANFEPFYTAIYNLGSENKYWNTVYSSVIKISTISPQATTPYNGINITTNTYIQGNLGIGTTNPAGTLVVSTATTATAPAIFVSNTGATAGYVGIGTTAPGQRLDVNGRIRIVNSQTELYQESNRLKIRAENIDRVAEFATYGLFLPRLNMGYNLFIAKSMQLGHSEPNPVISYKNGDLIFSADVTERVRFTSDGNVGIGTTNPQAKLDIYGDTSTTGTLFKVGAATITVLANGNVGIGTTNAPNILTIQQNSATDPIADGWLTYSSIRYKINISTITNATDKIKQLYGVYFNWKDTGKHDVGMVAEEVGKIIPEAVEYEEDGVNAKGIDYGKLVPFLIQAIKELNDKIEILENKLNK